MGAKRKHVIKRPKIYQYRQVSVILRQELKKEGVKKVRFSQI
ncbi:hypothetical protein HpBHB28_23340 [Helicobacter pylori]